MTEMTWIIYLKKKQGLLKQKDILYVIGPQTTGMYFIHILL